MTVPDFPEGLPPDWEDMLRRVMDDVGKHIAGHEFLTFMVDPKHAGIGALTAYSPVVVDLIQSALEGAWGMDGEMKGIFASRFYPHKRYIMPLVMIAARRSKEISIRIEAIGALTNQVGTTEGIDVIAGLRHIRDDESDEVIVREAAALAVVRLSNCTIYQITLPFVAEVARSFWMKPSSFSVPPDRYDRLMKGDWYDFRPSDEGE